jgi:Tol biopolymer transport system component
LSLLQGFADMKRQTSSAVKALTLLLCSLGFSGALVCAQVSDPIKAASITPLQGATGGSGSYSPIFSADGRFIVFTSRANNLVTNDSNAIWLDVFVRDLTNATTRLVSVSSTGIGGGNGNSFYPSISSNGQFIAFESAATNLAAGDTNSVNDVFVRDMIAGTTTLASVATNGVTSGNGVSRFPVMSADGSRVAFESTAPDLTLDDTNSLQDVFVRDLQTSTTIMVSREVQTSTNGFESPSISADGQRIAFASSSVLSFTNPNRKSDVYVYDSSSGITFWASSNINNLAALVQSYNPALSVDGQFVVIESRIRTNANFGYNAARLYLHLCDLQTLATTFISSNLVDDSFPEISSDGRFVAFGSLANVFVWDRLTGSNTLVSVDVTGTNAANGTSFRPVLTSDGSKIAFLSDSSNITSNVGNGQPQIYVRDLFTGFTRLVSVNLDEQPLTSMSGVVPAITADGNRVAFWSTDERIVPDDQNKDADVFLRDLNAGTTSLISARDTDLPSQTIAGFLSLSGDSVGADGRFVIFSALGSGLVGGESNVLHVYVRDLATGTNLPVDALENPDGLPVDPSNLPFPTNFTARFPVICANGRYVAYVGQITTNSALDQVYVRDLQSSTNWLVSRKWDGSGPGTAKSYAPSLSGDGRWLAFQSDAANLAPIDSNGKSDVFVRDVANATNFMVSLNRYGTNSANNFSTNSVISRDGRWVLFQSQATDLVTNAFDPYPQLFVRDLFSNTTMLVSKESNGLGLTRDSGRPVINPGCTFVLFTNWNRLVFLYDLLAQTNSLVCSNCYNPAMSADGRWVVVETLLRTNKIKDILLIDRQTGATNLISVNQAGTDEGNGSSTSPLITFDGRYIVFASQASNLVDNDNNGQTDIFVRDRIMNTTILASLNRQGSGSGNSASSKPILGADGRTVVFQSFSSDFIANDFNNNFDVFVLRFDAGDSDGDGMADDWELAYFGNLLRNGAGDFDGDGHTDFQEFLAGTDPSNSGSILRVMTITSLSGSTTILWSATPGKNYRVQFKTDLTDPGWIDLSGIVTATDSSASRMDNPGGVGGQRFYRVVLMP